MNDKRHTPLHIIPSDIVNSILDSNIDEIMHLVSETYIEHELGRTTNPDSYFLRFPQDESRRIIALPAAIHGDNGVSGIKWIASYPENLKQGIQRASAVLILNDAETGYPVAVLEGSKISAVRTAASAVLGAYWINDKSKRLDTLSIIGSGFIAQNIIKMFSQNEWDIGNVIIHDIDSASALALVGFVKSETIYQAEVASLDKALSAKTVVFATNAGTPYVKEPINFKPSQTILNISLRDIAPEIILKSQNIFDDVSHCLKANTSPHLAEQLVNNRDFVNGTLASVMLGKSKLNSDKAVIYSPFGLGVLDLALGRFILDKAVKDNSSTIIPNFLGDMKRW